MINDVQLGKPVGSQTLTLGSAAPDPRPPASKIGSAIRNEANPPGINRPAISNRSKTPFLISPFRRQIFLIGTSAIRNRHKVPQISDIVLSNRHKNDEQLRCVSHSLLDPLVPLAASHSLALRRQAEGPPRHCLPNRHPVIRIRSNSFRIRENFISNRREIRFVNPGRFCGTRLLCPQRFSGTLKSFPARDGNPYLIQGGSPPGYESRPPIGSPAFPFEPHPAKHYNSRVQHQRRGLPAIC
jgi:hypothetical protein